MYCHLAGPQNPRIYRADLGNENVAVWGRPVPAPTRDFVLAARTLKPCSLPGQSRVTRSLRKEHLKSSLWESGGARAHMSDWLTGSANSMTCTKRMHASPQRHLQMPSDSVCFRGNGHSGQSPGHGTNNKYQAPCLIPAHFEVHPQRHPGGDWRVPTATNSGQRYLRL